MPKSKTGEEQVANKKGTREAGENVFPFPSCRETGTPAKYYFVGLREKHNRINLSVN
jgi:hypothetical protein